VLPADGIRLLAQAHGYPGSSPVGRSPVVLHLNASNGLAPPYDWVRAASTKRARSMSGMPRVTHRVGAAVLAGLYAALGVATSAAAAKRLRRAAHACYIAAAQFLLAVGFLRPQRATPPAG
jgi:hypothetical protein